MTDYETLILFLHPYNKSIFFYNDSTTNLCF